MEGSYYYRRDETVLMGGSGDAASTGKLTISSYGDGVTITEYEFTIAVPVTSGLLGLESGSQNRTALLVGRLRERRNSGVLDVGNVNPIAAASVAPLKNTPEPGPGVPHLRAESRCWQWASFWRKQTM